MFWKTTHTGNTKMIHICHALRHRADDRRNPSRKTKGSHVAKLATCDTGGCRYLLHHWNINVVILTTFSSLVARLIVSINFSNVGLFEIHFLILHRVHQNPINHTRYRLSWFTLPEPCSTFCHVVDILAVTFACCCFCPCMQTWQRTHDTHRVAWHYT